MPPRGDFLHVQRIQDGIAGATSHANEALESIGALFKVADQGQTLINVNELVVETLQVLQKELDEYGIATSTRLAPDLPLIAGHRGQLREVVLNLVQNAIDAMGAFTSTHRFLKLETMRQGQDEVCLSIQDTGPGIEQQKITRVFDAFVTTKNKGMGMGLAISRMIVERHGGQISVRSDPESGARFQIMLPTKMTAESTM
jgi:signal transduction histidine kinase